MLFARHKLRAVEPHGPACRLPVVQEGTHGVLAIAARLEAEINNWRWLSDFAFTHSVSYVARQNIPVAKTLPSEN